MDGALDALGRASVSSRISRDRAGEVLDFPHGSDHPTLGEGAGELDLVVVDVLAQAPQAWDDDRVVPHPRGGEHAADTGMGHDNIGGLEAGEHFVERHEGHRPSSARGRRRGTVLDHELIGAQPAEGID